MESSPRISASSGTYSLVKPKWPAPWGSSYTFSKQSQHQPHHCVFHTSAVILSANTQKRLTSQSSRAIMSPRSPGTKDHLNGTDFSTSLFSVPLICSSSFHEIQSLSFQRFPDEKKETTGYKSLKSTVYIFYKEIQNNYGQEFYFINIEK